MATKLAISPIEIQVGDIYQGKRIVYVGSQGDVVYVDYETGGSATFSKYGQIEVMREIERINQ